MSVNDPDGPPEEPLTEEQFVACLIRGGWSEEAAKEEWGNWTQPVYKSQLEW